MPYDHKKFFDYVRQALFSGSLSQQQVDGMEAILSVWEKFTDNKPQSWLADMLATTYHETAQEMTPIEEYGRGGDAEYAQIDPETNQGYWGRGFVQLTWRDNYRKSDEEIARVFGVNSTGKKYASEWNADYQLEPIRAMMTMYLGMSQGWFRSDGNGPQTLERYFNDTTEDAYGAREIINGDKHIVPSWSDGVSIGNLIKGYYEEFLEALTRARIEAPEPQPPQPEPREPVNVAITAPEGVQVIVSLNGKEL